MTTYPIPVEERLTMKARFPDDEDCALCLQSMKGNLVIRLPCGHHYHEKCHARLRCEAASYRYRCPSCRSDVKKQIQRLKVYELWGDNIWDQYQCYVRSLDGGAPPWDSDYGKRKVETFERWILEGLSEEELSELSNAQHDHSLQGPVVHPVPHEDQPDENSDEYWEQYFAYMTESDEESQPDSP